MGGVLMFPQWFIDKLVLQSDKDKAVRGELKAKDRVVLRCSIHGEYVRAVGNEIVIKTGEHKSSFECPKCGSKYRTDIARKETQTKQAKINRKLNQAHNRKYEYDVSGELREDYRKMFESKELGSTSEVVFICNEHGEYNQRLADHFRALRVCGCGCPRCNRRNSIKEWRTRKRPEYPQWFIDELVLDKDKIRAKNGTLSSKEEVLFKCPNGHVYKSLVNTHIVMKTGERDCGCPECNVRKVFSDIEREVSDFIKSLGYEVQNNVRGLIHSDITGQPMELDIYIPSIRSAVEVNGSYFHASEGNSLEYRKDKYYHQMKMRLCDEKKINLIHIYEIDIDLNKDKVFSSLKYRLENPPDFDRIVGYTEPTFYRTNGHKLDLEGRYLVYREGERIFS